MPFKESIMKLYWSKGQIFWKPLKKRCSAMLKGLKSLITFMSERSSSCHRVNSSWPKLTILVTLKECAETARRHLWESGPKAINALQRIYYETLLDQDSNILETFKEKMLCKVKRFEVIHHIYVRKVKQLDNEISLMIKTVGYCDPTNLSLYFKNLI